MHFTVGGFVDKQMYVEVAVDSGHPVKMFVGSNLISFTYKEAGELYEKLGFALQEYEGVGEEAEEVSPPTD